MSAEMTSVSAEEDQLQVDTARVAISEIPLFLHESEFYRSLDKDELAGSIVIPPTCYKDSDTVSSVDDLERLLRTMMFWGLDSWPLELIDFCASTHINQWEDVFDSVWGDNEEEDLALLKVYFMNPGSIACAICIKKHEFISHWIEKNPPESEYGTHATEIAVLENELELLIKLHDEGYPLTNDACIVAVEHGHVECLKYLHNHDAPWDDSNVSAAAAQFGQLECLHYLHKSGCAWHAEVSTRAALYGHLNVLQYAHTHGCPWDAIVCTAAASHNHLDCLVYAHENGCPWDDTLTDIVTKVGCDDCLAYALENGCPLHTNAVLNCVLLNRQACLVVLVEFGVNLEATLVSRAAQNGQLSILMYLFDIGCPYDETLLTDAACCNKGSALECVTYLVNEQFVPFDKHAFSSALCSGHTDVVSYLVDNGCECVFVPDQFVIMDVSKDALIMDCIEYVYGHGIAIAVELVSFVFSRNLPRCQLYLESIGYSAPLMASFGAFRLWPDSQCLSASHEYL